MDGDDLIIPEAVEQLLAKAETNKLDVLVFNYKEWEADREEIIQNYSLPKSSVKRGVELSNEIFAGGLVNNMGYPVRFLLKREYMSNCKILFPENMRYGEDTVWMARVCLSATRMASVSDYGYIYWHHVDSTCGMLKNMYPGKTIFEKCVKTSLQLKDFVEELRNYGISNNDSLFINQANDIIVFTRSHYVNSLPIMLSRSTWNERREFYTYVSAYGRIKEIYQFTNKLTRMLYVPMVGQLVSECLAFIYKLKHGNNKV